MLTASSFAAAAAVMVVDGCQQKRKLFRVMMKWLLYCEPISIESIHPELCMQLSTEGKNLNYLNLNNLI